MLLLILFSRVYQLSLSDRLALSSRLAGTRVGGGAPGVLFKLLGELFAKHIIKTGQFGGMR